MLENSGKDVKTIPFGYYKSTEGFVQNQSKNRMENPEKTVERKAGFTENITRKIKNTVHE